MRLAAVLLLCAACDFQPPPKKAPPVESPPTNPPAQTIDAPVAVAPSTGSGSDVGSGSGSGLAPRRVESSQACIDAAAKITGLMIDNSKDDMLKAQLEQDRTKTVRRVAEACTKDAWPADVLTCITNAGDMTALQACTQKLRAPD